MKQSHVITIALTLLVVGALFWIGNSGRSSFSEPPLGANSSGTVPGQSGSLTAEESAFDFGTVSMAKGTVTHRFALTNGGTEPITATKLYTSCMCTTATLDVAGKRTGPFGMPGHGFTPKFSQSITPGETAYLDVAFDPAAHGPAGVGRIERVISLETDQGAPLAIKISANVTP